MSFNTFILKHEEVADPEVRAMLQAFFSRSPMPIQERLSSLGGKEDRIKAALGTYYIGYGHESIGELGDTTVFIEGVSMAAAKAIQDHELYRGQECSTRYINFDKQPFFAGTYHTPELAAKAQELIEKWRGIYQDVLGQLQYVVERAYAREFVLPADKQGDEALYTKTIKSICFDIARGLLPIGATTSVAWSGDLRNLGRHCRKLMCSPLPEVAHVGAQVYADLCEAYPNSFAAYTPTEVHRQMAKDGYYGMEFFHDENVDVQYREIGGASDVLAALKKGYFHKENLEHLPRPLRYAARIQISDTLDYASYRDLQRHRPGLMTLALPDASEMHLDSWYCAWYDTLGPFISNRVNQLLSEISAFFLDDVAPNQPYQEQYLIPMGVKVPVSVDWSLHEAVYVCNLRSGVTVHPTLRAKIRSWAPAIVERLGLEIAAVDRLFTLDKREDYQATRRGQQDIVQKT